VSDRPEIAAIRYARKTLNSRCGSDLSDVTDGYTFGSFRSNDVAVDFSLSWVGWGKLEKRLSARVIKKDHHTYVSVHYSTTCKLRAHRAAVVLLKSVYAFLQSHP